MLSKTLVQQGIIPKGWTSIMITISVLCGFQLLALWVLSLYVAKIYREVLSRPTYLIKKDSLAEKTHNDLLTTGPKVDEFEDNKQSL